MENKKEDFLSIILQPYVLDILRALRKQPTRFNDLKTKVPNARTLSLKLSKLQDHSFIEMVHSKAGGSYVNVYQLTERGKKLVKALEKLK